MQLNAFKVVLNTSTNKKETTRGKDVIESVFTQVIRIKNVVEMCAYFFFCNFISLQDIDLVR